MLIERIVDPSSLVCRESLKKVSLKNLKLKNIEAHLRKKQHPAELVGATLAKHQLDWSEID